MNNKTKVLLASGLLISILIDFFILYDFPKLFISVLIFTLVTFVIDAAFRASFDNVEKKDGNLFLRPSKIYKILGMTGIVISVIFAVIPFILPVVAVSKDVEYAAYAGLFLLLLSLPTYASSKHFIKVGETKITSYGLWRKPKEVDWSEIDKVKFNKISMYLSLFRGSEKIRVHMQHVGFAQFMDLVKRKVDPSLYEEPAKKIQEVYKARGF